MKTKIFWITISILISLHLMAPIASADPVLTLRPSVEQIKPGEQFTLLIQIDEVVDLFAVSIELIFDGSLIEVTDASAGDFLGNDVLFFNMSQDNSVGIAISRKSGKDGASGSGILASVQFQAVAQGKANISVKADKLTLTQSDGNSIPDFEKLVIVPCEVEIISEAASPEPGLKLKPSLEKVELGQEFTIQIQVYELENLFAASVELLFDETLLKVTRASARDFLGNDVLFFDMPGDSSISMAISRRAGSESINGSGILASVNFQAIDHGNASISINMDKLMLTKSDGSPIPDFEKLAIVPCEVEIIDMPTSLSIDPSENQIKVGDEITLKVFISNAKMLSGISFEIQFDGDILEYVSTTSGDFLGENAAFFSIGASDKVGIAAFIKIGGTPTNGSGEIASITFRGKAAGKSSITFRLDTASLKRDDGSSIEFVAENGSISIISDTEEDANGELGPQIIGLKQSKLLPNYPNPFNPETWIPYELPENLDVTIKIHDVAGRLIRTLELGNKPAGFYTTKDKAAYWDGKNEAGEPVASGIYFYSIQAGNFTSTRKMVVAK